MVDFEPGVVGQHHLTGKKPAVVDRLFKGVVFKGQGVFRRGLDGVEAGEGKNPYVVARGGQRKVAQLARVGAGDVEGASHQRKGARGSLHSEASDRNDACPRRPPAHGIRSRAASEIPAGRGQMRHPPVVAARRISGPGRRGRGGRRCGADTHRRRRRDGAARRAEWRRLFPRLRRAEPAVGGEQRGVGWAASRASEEPCCSIEKGDECLDGRSLAHHVSRGTDEHAQLRPPEWPAGRRGSSRHVRPGWRWSVPLPATEVFWVR